MLRKLGVVFVVCTGVVSLSGRVAATTVVRWDSFGTVRVGMTLAQLNKALKTSYVRPSDPDERSCFYVGVPNVSGVGIMILDGRVARADVDNASISTAEGVHNQDSEARAIQVHGKRLQIEPHSYLPETGHYLTLISPDRNYGIRFETEDGKITRYYAGTIKAISFIEGCS